MEYEIEVVEVDGNPMEVFIFKPAEAGACPAIILAQHIPVGHAGLEHDDFTLVTAARYAAAGYVVAVPFIFHWWPKDEEMAVKAKEFRDDWTVLDLQATQQLLVERDDVDANRIAIVGHCWGGRVSWLGACHLEDLCACGIFYGGRIKLALGKGFQPAIELADRINCPLIGFFGNEDQNPTPEEVDDYEAALKKAEVDYTFYRYDNAGHAFQNFPTPDRYRESQSEDAWEKILAFLADRFGKQERVNN